MIVPALIGATGGSGTRALRLALIACGAHFGARTNEAGDAADLFPFYDQHINPTLVKPPESIGRWRRLQPNQQVLLTTVAAEGLRRFGYDASTPS